jgi:hypothetical protein
MGAVAEGVELGSSAVVVEALATEDGIRAGVTVDVICNPRKTTATANIMEGATPSLGCRIEKAHLAPSPESS